MSHIYTLCVNTEFTKFVFGNLCLVSCKKMGTEMHILRIAYVVIRLLFQNLYFVCVNNELSIESKKVWVQNHVASAL